MNNQGPTLVTILGISSFFVLKSLYSPPKKNYHNQANSNVEGNGFTPTSGFPGSLDESYLNIPSPPATLPTKYNNPLSIKYRDSNNWNGKILRLPNENRAFEKFISYPHGIRAGIYLLKNRYLGAGYNTVERIIQRYAPIWDNRAENQNNYINFVSRRIGIGRTTPISNNKNTIKSLVQAMARFEGGQTRFGSPELITDIQFETGWSIL